MKLLCLGDGHCTDSRPVNRTDNYWETVKRKSSFVLEVAKQKKVDLILSPGDWTDTPSLSNLELYQLIDLFNAFLQVDFLTTWGQHDLRFRTKPNTSLMVLEHAIEKFWIVGPGGSIPNYHNEQEDIFIQASGYGEEVPEPIEGRFNILIIHRMIIEEKLWSAQEIYEPSNVFLRQHQFDLIVSGDNHQPFIAQAPGSKRVLINCGAMLRNKIDMTDHKPFVVLFDTKTKKHEQIYIPIEPADKVFRMEKVIAEQERNENLESFVTGLSQQKEVGLLFQDNLNAYAKENKIEQEVMDEINESFIVQKG